MRVLMFVSNPFTNDPRVYAEAHSLANAGYQVTVIACDRRGENPPIGNQDGIEVIRLSPFMARQRGALKVLSTVLGPLSWHLVAYRRAVEMWKQRRFEVIHCHDLDTLAIGVALKRRLGLPLIYDAHEVYAYMAARSIPRPLTHFFVCLERVLLRWVDRIIIVVEPHRAYFSSLTKKPLSIVMNCKPLQTVEYQPPGHAGVFTILYIGALHRGRAILMLIDAVSGLSDVQCIIGGIGSPHYVNLVENRIKSVPNATFIGKVPFEEVIPMTKKADAAFLMIDPHDLNNRLGLGNKQFEAMVCGRPIICTKGTYSGDLTQQEEAGLSVDYTTEALKQAIITLRDDAELRELLGRNALRAAISKYNWSAQEKALLDVYRSLTTTNP